MKVSGDLFLAENFLEWVANLCRENTVVICVGGGTQINEEFNRKGLEIKKHPILGRETTTEGLRIAYDVLHGNKALLKNELRSRGAEASVILPMVYMGEEICHVDADLMVTNAYWGFDSLYVVTTKDRTEEKQRYFADPLRKIALKSF